MSSETQNFSLLSLPTRFFSQRYFFFVFIDIFTASLALLLELVLSLQTEKKSYDEYSVLRAYPTSQEDLDLLHSIGNLS